MFFLALKFPRQCTLDLVVKVGGIELKSLGSDLVYGHAAVALQNNY
jgi:hypothetical protein